MHCVCTISTFLSNWNDIDLDFTNKYLHNCKTSFDGGIGLIPTQQSHGESIFCGVASLKLMGMDGDNGNKEWKRNVIRWCTQRH